MRRRAGRVGAAMSAIALPPNSDPDMVDKWEVDPTGEYPTYRCLWSNLLYASPSIRVVGIQLADGSMCLDDGDAPAVYLDLEPISTEAARAVAAALNAAADLAESWGTQLAYPVGVFDERLRQHPRLPQRPGQAPRSARAGSRRMGPDSVVPVDRRRVLQRRPPGPQLRGGAPADGDQTPTT